MSKTIKHPTARYRADDRPALHRPIHTADATTSEERRMIDEFIRRHGVTNIPPGGFPHEIAARDEAIRAKMRKRAKRSHARALQSKAEMKIRKQAKGTRQ